MQLSHPAETLKVDFYPHNILSDRYVKVVTFENGYESESLINKKDMEREIDSRLAFGYTVTEFNTETRSKSICAC